ncbi:MAG: hypothetical protein R3Y21_03250 [Mycoplasmatota bacterium]
MDLLIIVILVVIVALYFKRFSNVVYLIGFIDMFCRVFHTMVINIGLLEVRSFLYDLNIPYSIGSLLSTYSTGILYTILLWIYIIFMWIFIYYLLKVVIKRR